MAHRISNVTGTNEMFYTGDTPWHGLGQKLDKAATSKEAIEAAHLDYKVGVYSVYYQMPDGKMVQAKEKGAIVREDTGTFFQVMSNRYTPVQNKDAFGFFDNVVAAGEAVYHTAGALDEGKRIWILAKLSGEFKVAKDDVVEKYVLLANSHDGSEALTMMVTPIRVVCHNTLSVALQDKKASRFYARHTVRVMNRATQAREILGLTEEYFKNFQAGADRLVAYQIKQKELEEMLRWTLHTVDAKEMDKQHASKKVAIEEITRLFEHGKGNDMPGVKGTAWGLYNAVGEYVDWSRPAGKGVKTLCVSTAAVVSQRLDSAWFGSGANLKQKSWDYLLQLATT